MSASKRTITEEQLAEMFEDSSYIHSHADGISCGSCAIPVKPRHDASSCPGCGRPLAATVIAHGAMDIQLHGRPVYYLAPPNVEAQPYAN